MSSSVANPPSVASASAVSDFDAKSDGGGPKPNGGLLADLTVNSEYISGGVASGPEDVGIHTGRTGESFRASKITEQLGHRRVDDKGTVTYKKKPTSELMGCIQIGIEWAIGNLANKPERDLLLQDFEEVESVSFPCEGSKLTPAHMYSDYRFKCYAPIAFRYFRDIFKIKPDDFLALKGTLGPLFEQ